MANRIQLTPEVLKDQSQEMTSLMRKYEELFSGITTTLKNTNSQWSENLANNFSGKIMAAQKNFSGIVSMLGAGASAAMTSATTMGSVDNALKKMAEGVFDFSKGPWVAEKYKAAGGGRSSGGGGKNAPGGDGGFGGREELPNWIKEGVGRFKELQGVLERAMKRPKLPACVHDYTKIETDPYRRNEANLDAFEYYTAVDGSRGHICTFNRGGYPNGEVSCTFYTLKRLRERGRGFPFASAGNADGGNWYNNSSGVAKELGWSSLDILLNKYGGKEKTIENVVVSFDGPSDQGHVLLVDRVWKDQNGQLMVTFSDMYDYSHLLGATGRASKGYLHDPYGYNPTITCAYDEFKKVYQSVNGNMVGSVYIG